MRIGKRIVSTGIAGVVAAAGLARAQCDWQRIYSGDPQTDAYTGEAAAIDGAYVLLGAGGQNVSGHSGAGEVYAFAPFGNIYGQVAHITAPTPGNGDAFGYSVALGGGAQWCVVGAPFASQSQGHAYIFRRDVNTNLWNLSGDLGPGSSGGQAGISVAINSAGTVAVVGAPNATVSDLFGTTIGAGQAEVYTRSGNTWTAQFDLHQYDASIRHTADAYGLAVACDGSTVLTGSCRGGDAAHSGCGYVHFWTPGPNSQWMADGEVYAPDAANGAYFGEAVGLSGGYAVIGAPGATYMGMASAGAAYVYRLVAGSWVYDSTLHASDAAMGDQFGSTVSIRGNHLVVGTTNISVQKVYDFRRTPAGAWVQDGMFQNPGASGNRFASDIGVSDTQVVVGDWAFGTPNYSASGCGYIFDLPAVGSDSCEGATPTSQGSVSGCTNYATIDGATTCGGGVPGPDVWFDYAAPATGQVSIDTQGSTLDTVLSVHTGCPGTAANSIACNDDFAAPQRWSKVTVGVVQGQHYRIRIAGYGNSVGAYVLNMGPVAASCYANCDNSSAAPVLNVNDFICFQSRFAAGDPYANCDGSTTIPVLNVNDFICFQSQFAAGCQ